MWMIAGLGNPGPDYADTRHNMGFAVVDALAALWGVEVTQRKFGARTATVAVEGKTILLLKPWTYMNRSGQSVATAAGFYKLPPEQVMVVLDDMDLEPGRIRLRSSGSAGGHHGLEDVIRGLGTDGFARCRVGIGSRGRQEGAGYVLGRPSAGEQALLDAAVLRSRDAVRHWIDHGIDKTMTQFNRDPADGVPNE
ncbi:MAG: aminoacyl-tRNA hydrolase [Phycisphaerae bacterium]|nr:aminoacyl-tRNA hydrolase [Phycisphaerae bacterium]